MAAWRRGRWLASAALLVLGLGGCALTDERSAAAPQAGDAPYVGVFTGEYVDGKPLYRFPPIHVVGSRRSADGM